MLNNSTFIYLCKTVKDLVRIIKTIVSFFSNDFFVKIDTGKYLLLVKRMYFVILLLSLAFKDPLINHIYKIIELIRLE